MEYLIGVPLLALLSVVQATILADLTVLRGRPDLVLITIIAWSLTGRWKASMLLGLFGGLLLDLQSGMPFGIGAAVMVFCAFLVSQLEGRLWEAHFLTAPGVTLIVSMVYHAAMIGTIMLMGRRVDLPVALIEVVLPSTFLNLLLVVPLSQLAESLHDRLFPAKVGI